jgi:hypothetical protein
MEAVASIPVEEATEEEADAPDRVAVEHINNC